MQDNISDPISTVPAEIDDTPNRPTTGGIDPETVREGTGPDILVLAAEITRFRADLGGLDNGDLPPRESGSRSINSGVMYFFGRRSGSSKDSRSGIWL